MSIVEDRLCKQTDSQDSTLNARCPNGTKKGEPGVGVISICFFSIIFITIQNQVAEIIQKGMKITKLYNEFQLQNTYFKIYLGCLRIQTWGDAGFQLHEFCTK